MGCRYCMVACPFSVPKYEWGKLLPQGTEMHHVPAIGLQQGKQTACAEICPTGATKFGERDALIAEAQKRIHDNPGKYVESHLWPEEVGGTSVLLLSSVPFESFGYRTDLAEDPLPMLTYRVLSHIPDFVPLGRNGAGRSLVDHASPRRGRAAEGAKTRPTRRTEGSDNDRIHIPAHFLEACLPLPDGRRASTPLSSASRRAWALRPT